MVAMRLLLLALYVLLAYFALRAVLRWLLRASEQPGVEDLVLDPECGIYIIKRSAVTRRVSGILLHFCTKECASAYVAKRRDDKSS